MTITMQSTHIQTNLYPYESKFADYCIVETQFLFLVTMTFVYDLHDQKSRVISFLMSRPHIYTKFEDDCIISS